MSHIPLLGRDSCVLKAVSRGRLPGPHDPDCGVHGVNPDRDAAKLNEIYAFISPDVFYDVSYAPYILR